MAIWNSTKILITFFISEGIENNSLYYQYITRYLYIYIDEKFFIRINIKIVWMMFKLWIKEARTYIYTYARKEGNVFI